MATKKKTTLDGSEVKPPEQNAPQAYDDAGIDADKNEFSAGRSGDAAEQAEGVDEGNDDDAD